MPSSSGGLRQVRSTVRLAKINFPDEDVVQGGVAAENTYRKRGNGARSCSTRLWVERCCFRSAAAESAERSISYSEGTGMLVVKMRLVFALDRVY